MSVLSRSIWILCATWTLFACGDSGGERTSVRTDAGETGATARALAILEPLAAADAGAPAPRAMAMFVAIQPGVSLQIMVTDCETDRLYPIHIHAGMSCESSALQGGHWDAPRGEGIPEVNCVSSGGSAQYHVRSSTDPKPWSVGDGAASDIVGHVMVLHDPDSEQPIACGVIELVQARVEPAP